MDYNKYLKYKIKYNIFNNKEENKYENKLEKGQIVRYRNHKEDVLATIIMVHYDDITPYYTIKIENREKQTERNKLTPIYS